MLQADALVQTPVVNPFPSALEHRFAEVDPDDVRVSRVRECDGDAGGAGCDVEDAARLEAHDVADERAAPLAVLAEREDLGQAVVFRRQILEEVGRERVLRAGGRRAGFLHARHLSTGTQVPPSVPTLIRSSSVT